MNFKYVYYTLGKVVALEAGMLILPLIVAIIYKDDPMPFLVTIFASLTIGIGITMVSSPESKKLSARDGFLIVSLSWILLSLLGALPFVLSKAVPSYIDAVFETMSGFTTTGASILNDVEVLSHSLLFWRSLTHWIGGMGVLVFLMAIAERNPDRSINIIRAEMPGSRVDKLRPKAKSTALILYNIYITMTAIEIVLLLIGGMSLYDSLVHTFGTAGTGGFGIKADSIASYSSYLQYIIAIFMLLFGVNFGLYYLVLAGKWRSIFRSAELKWYLGIVAVSVLIITWNIHPITGSLSDSFRDSLFQVSSIITTTGYSTVDFDAWPSLSKAILLVLMFIGGCEGSTAGGFKVNRVMIMFHNIRNEAKHSLHPRLVSAVRINNKVVSKETVSGVSAYLGLYILTGLIILLLISHEPMGFETNFTAVAACFNNIGPGFAGVGPAASFAAYSQVSKVILTIAMLLGRLEIYPVLLAFIPVDVRK